MIAEDYSDSSVGAATIYQMIRERLLKAPRNKLIPLVYAVDSILKNAKGHYITQVEADAESWIPTVYKQLQEPQKAKLEKMWKTWNDSRIFSPEKLKAMGRCFDSNSSGKSLTSGGATSEVAGISRTVRYVVIAGCVIMLPRANAHKELARTNTFLIPRTVSSPHSERRDIGTSSGIARRNGKCLGRCSKRLCRARQSFAGTYCRH